MVGCNHVNLDGLRALELSWTNGLDDIRMIWMDTSGGGGTTEMHHEVHLLDMI
jgi:hypothetical protein